MSIKRRSFIGTFTAVALLASSTTHAADGAAKRIMVDGDSNSWGFILVESGSTTRHPADVRWPGVLKVALGQNCNVIEEGLCARTTDIPDLRSLTSQAFALMEPSSWMEAPSRPQMVSMAFT